VLNRDPLCFGSPASVRRDRTTLPSRRGNCILRATKRFDRS
jgi:hypothetical protein